jgi:hypothetical protein
MNKKQKKLLKKAFIAGAMATTYSSDPVTMKKTRQRVHPLLKHFWKNFLVQLKEEEEG